MKLEKALRIGHKEFRKHSSKLITHTPEGEDKDHHDHHHHDDEEDDHHHCHEKEL